MLFFFFFFSLASFLCFAHLLFKFLPFPSWAAEMRTLLVLFLQELLFYYFQCLKTSIQSLTASILRIPSKMSSEGNHDPKLEIVESVETMSVLDLPELVLESILGRLPPASLCSMSDVCSSMKDRCRSDHLWEKHMKEKWGRVIGTAACREWQLYVSSRKDYLQRDSSERNAKRWIGALASVWPISLIVPKRDNGSNSRNSLPVDSIMDWYLALESGRFWFPAQVYNRESEHVGFMLSCYDAELSYDCSTDTFHARYPPHGRRTVVIENHVQWDRIRAPAIDTPADALHVSDCLSDLQPGDHFEIQWRRNKEYPYGWWYGVVGHLESCDGNELHCRCDSNETVVLEFNQYALGSRWRRTLINRKDHREEGNEMVGFYGGIRKLQDKQEISKWRRLWPTETLV